MRWIPLLVVVDVVVTAAVILYVFHKRGGFALLGAPGVNLAHLKAFSDSAHTLIGDYMRANYGGQPESLPGLLSSLLDQLEARAAAEKLPLNREALKMVLLRSLTAEHTVSAREVQAALRHVA